MRFLNGIFEDYAFVIDELNSDMVDLHFVHSNESLHLSIYNNAGAFADHENIMENCGLWSFTLNVEASLGTADQSIVAEDKNILWS